MLTSLLWEARIWPVVWRRRLAYWLVGNKENLAFLVMLGLPILGVAGLIYFFFVGGKRLEPAPPSGAERGGTPARRRANDLPSPPPNNHFGTPREARRGP